MAGKITIGKEYELATNGLFTHGRDTKMEDGSGPSEFSVGPFRSIKEAITTEILLEELYGSALYRYYVREDNTEEKGNHFHVKIGKLSNMVDLYCGLSTIGYAFRKFYTDSLSFRNSFEEWNARITHGILDVSDVKYWSGRKYTMYTLNRNRKRTLTVEVRASENSIVGDIINLLLSIPFINELIKIEDKTLLIKQINTLSYIIPVREVNTYETYINKEFYEEIFKKTFYNEYIENIDNFNDKTYVIRFKPLSSSLISRIIKYYSNNKRELNRLIDVEEALFILERVKVYAERNEARQVLYQSIKRMIKASIDKKTLKNAMKQINKTFFSELLSEMGLSKEIEILLK